MHCGVQASRDILEIAPAPNQGAWLCCAKPWFFTSSEKTPKIPWNKCKILPAAHRALCNLPYSLCALSCPALSPSSLSAPAMHVSSLFLQHPGRSCPRAFAWTCLCLELSFSHILLRPAPFHLWAQRECHLLKHVSPGPCGSYFTLQRTREFSVCLPASCRLSSADSSF